jgi:hypothetical protein
VYLLGSPSSSQPLSAGIFSPCTLTPPSFLGNFLSLQPHLVSHSIISCLVFNYSVLLATIASLPFSGFFPAQQLAHPSDLRLLIIYWLPWIWFNLTNVWTVVTLHSISSQCSSELWFYIHLCDCLINIYLSMRL